MRGACRLRQFWRFNLILTHCGFLGRASAKQSEISENSEHSDGLADARTMVCRSWLTAYPPGGDGALCGAGQPATASGVAIIYVFSVLRACRRHPGRRNTRLRTAATACRGGGNVRLLSSSSPFVIVSAGGGGDAIHRVRAIKCKFRQYNG